LTITLRPTVARVDTSAIVANYRALGRAAGRRVLPVVKADAYGHGAAAVGRALEAAGTDFLCVAIAEEGAALRRAGVGCRILLLNYCCALDAGFLRAYGLTPSISSPELAREFAQATEGFSEPLAVHVNVNTGMNRLGVDERELPDVLEALGRAKGLAVEAFFTHFSHGDEPDGVAMASQEDRASRLFSELRAHPVLRGAWTHAANSGAALSGKGAWADAVRPGIALFGVAPGPPSGVTLVPALAWETEVMAVRRVPAGTPVGYGGTFVASRESVLATLPVGYDDGYRRAFAGRVPVLLPGGKAPVVGAVSMDLTVCDATDTGARRGDRVVLLGTSGGETVTAEEMARAAGTIAYEIFCGIGRRVPRVTA
jgi:alanine racemase